MTKQLYRQVELDPERMRKAAERIEQVREEVRKLIADRSVAVQSLKIIATWATWLATERGSGVSASQIHDRAMDALRLMREAK